jgi:hypothetical protein
MRRGAAGVALIVGLGSVIYPIFLAHWDRGMLALGSLTFGVLVVALVFPRIPTVLSAFCGLWCCLYAIGLFVGGPGIDPLAPVMAAGLYVVVELSELTAVASSGVTLSTEVATDRIVNVALVGASAAVLATACLAVAGFTRAGGLGGVVLAAFGAASVLAIPTLVGRRTERRR